MPERYEVRTVADSAFGDGVYELLDHEVGSSARVAPAVGNNLFSLRVPIGGRGLEAFLRPDGPRRGFPFGNPILFPYPGRVREGRFSFGGRDYQLDVAPRMGHAIHGLVLQRPWKVEASGATGEGARVVASLESAEYPEIARQWPFPFRIAIGFTLSGDTVRPRRGGDERRGGPAPDGLRDPPLVPHAARRSGIAGAVPGEGARAAAVGGGAEHPADGPDPGPTRRPGLPGASPDRRDDARRQLHRRDARERGERVPLP